MSLSLAEQWLWDWRLRQPAKDSDGDGVTDWLEDLDHSDPHNALNSPLISVWASRFYFYREERSRLKFWLGIDGYKDVRWPIDTEVVVTCDSPILLAREADIATLPTKGPVRIKVTPDGYMECDVLWKVATDTERIRIVQTRSGRQIGPLEIRAVGWRLQERRSWIRIRSPDIDDYYAGDRGSRPEGYFGPPPLAPYLEWEPLPMKETIYMVEIARADTPDEWRDGYLTEPGEPTSIVSSDFGRYSFWYRGKFLYRVFPISAQRPGVSVSQ